MKRDGLRILLVGLGVAAWALTGCGEEPLECGQATQLENGECVLADDDCEDGEVLAPNGNCADPMYFCDDDAEYDVETGECVTTSEVVCGEGTVAEDGVCVLEDALECGENTVLVNEECRLSEDVCGPGTELDEQQCHVTEDACDGKAQYDVATGECVVLVEIECGEGTVEHENRCIPHTTYADELAAGADIDFIDDQPIVPNDDEPFVFTGQLDEQLFQTFELEGTEGQWLEITIYSRGLPSPGMQLIGPIDDWKRSVRAGLASTPSRTVVTPNDGEYQLTVNTSLTDSDSPDSFGDESWMYVGKVEVLDAPMADSWDFDAEDLGGDFTETVDNLVEIDVAGADELFVTPGAIGADIEGPTLELWEDSETFDTRVDLDVGDRRELDVTEFDELLLHVDAVETIGPRTDFEISARGTETLQPGELYDDEISADAGQTIAISHRSMEDRSMTVRVYRDEEFLGIWRDVLPGDMSASDYETDQTRQEYLRVTEGGDYRLEFQNTNDEEVTSFISTSGIEDHELYEIADDEPSDFSAELGGQDLTRGDWRVVFVETARPTFVDGSVDADGWSNPDVALYDADGERLQRTSGSGTGASASFNFTLPGAGVYMVAVQPDSNTSGIDNVEIEMESELFDYLEPGHHAEWTFDVETNDILNGLVTRTDGPDLDLRMSNPHGDVVFEEFGVDDYELIDRFPGPGEFVLEVHNNGNSTVVGLNVDAEATTPIDALDPAGDFAESYSLEGLDEGQRDYLLFRPQTDFQFSYSVVFGDDNDGRLRIWDLDEREVVIEESDAQRIDIVDQDIDEGLYAFEFEAESDIGAYDMAFNGSSVVFVDEIRTHDPPLEIDFGGGYETSAMAIDECSEIADISLSVDMPQTGTNSNVDIDLYAPGLSQPLAVRDGSSSASHTTVYPDTQTPAESFDDLHGTVGSGVWSLDIENNNSSTVVELAEWGLHLTCLE